MLFSTKGTPKVWETSNRHECIRVRFDHDIADDLFIVASWDFSSLLDKHKGKLFDQK